MSKKLKKEESKNLEVVEDTGLCDWEEDCEVAPDWEGMFNRQEEYIQELEKKLLNSNKAFDTVYSLLVEVLNHQDSQLKANSLVSRDTWGRLDNLINDLQMKNKKQSL